MARMKKSRRKKGRADEFSPSYDSSPSPSVREVSKRSEKRERERERRKGGRVFFVLRFNQQSSVLLMPRVRRGGKSAES